MKGSLAADLAAWVFDPERVLTNRQVVDRLSRDFYWYSPILKKELDGKAADIVVQPVSVEEIRDVLLYCYANEVPVTARGSGTGNYGQAVPLEGGVVLDLSRMDAIEKIRRTEWQCASRECAWGCSKKKREKRDGSCGAIPRPSSRRPWADFSAAARAASGPSRMAVCVIFRRSEQSKW